MMLIYVLQYANTFFNVHDIYTSVHQPNSQASSSFMPIAHIIASILKN